MDISEGRAAQTYRGGDVRQPALHKDHVGGVDRHVGSRSYRYPDVCARERGGIVYTVTDHSHLAARGKTFDLLLLAVRKHAGNDLVNSRFLAYGAGCALVIAREHDNMYAHSLQFADSLRAVLLYYIGNGDYAEQTVALGKEQRCFTGLGKRLCLFSNRSRNIYL